MLGVDPAKADDDFMITRFWMENGVPKFEFSHSADGAGNSYAARIKSKGKVKLSDTFTAFYPLFRAFSGRYVFSCRFLKELIVFAFKFFFLLN